MIKRESHFIIKKKDTLKMECPYCNGTMIIIENFK